MLHGKSFTFLLLQDLRGFAGRVFKQKGGKMGVLQEITCSGEKILYEKNDDIDNQFSLKSVQESFANIQEDKSSSDILMSYCYSRNF